MKNLKTKSLIIVIILFLSTIVGCQSWNTISDSDYPFDYQSGTQTLTEAQPLILDGILEMHVIDVSQGDCLFFLLPNNKTMLIDAGNTKYGIFVTEYIQRLDVSKIDYLILTHPHADHVGGMAAVVNNFAIDAIYITEIENPINAYRRFMEAVSDKEIPLLYAKSGIPLFEEDGLSAHFVAPVTQTKDDNNMSAVLYLTYGNTSFLLMGDAEKESENAILSAEFNIKADVLKVGHHGSATSTTAAFVEKVSPKYAVISCGEGNGYGHPKPETLATLNHYGIDIFRTDESGTLVFKSDGKEIIPPHIKSSPIQPNAPPEINEVKP